MQWAEQIDGVTEHYRAITIPQPDADLISRGEKAELLRKRGTDYRGKVLIVSSPTPKGERSGMIVGQATLYEVKKTEGGFLYCLDEMERMIEFPCQKCGARGEVWDCFYTANTLMSYPKINLRKWIGLEK